MGDKLPYSSCSLKRLLFYLYGRRDGLMVSALAPVFGSSDPGSSPGQGHCLVFMDKTLNSHSVSLHPGVSS